MQRVIGVTANEDFSLDLKFSDGSIKRFDVKPYLDYAVFRELKDLAYFKQVRLAVGTVQWPNEQDISPETLYLEGFVATLDTDDIASSLKPQILPNQRAKFPS